MIFIIIALWVVTVVLIRPRIKLSLKESGWLFFIYLCVGLTVRAILFAFGM